MVWKEKVSGNQDLGKSLSDMKLVANLNLWYRNIPLPVLSSPMTELSETTKVKSLIAFDNQRDYV